VRGGMGAWTEIASFSGRAPTFCKKCNIKTPFLLTPPALSSSYACIGEVPQTYGDGFQSVILPDFGSLVSGEVNLSFLFPPSLNQIACITTMAILPKQSARVFPLVFPFYSGVH